MIDSPRQPDCTSCPLNTCIKVWGQGPLDAEILGVAEAPGENEVREGIPLIGWTGTFVNETFAYYGFPRKAIRYENVYQCKATYGSKEGKAAALACGPSVWSTVRAMPNLRTVIAYGEASLRELSGYRAWEEEDRAFKRDSKKFLSWQKKYAKGAAVWADKEAKFASKLEEKRAAFEEKHAAWMAKPGKRKEPTFKALKAPMRPAILNAPVLEEPKAPLKRGVKGIMNFRGSPLWLHGYEGKIRLFPIIHPAACAPKRQPRLRPLIMADMRRATEFHNGTRVEQVPSIVEIRTAAKLREFLKTLPLGRNAYDIEWSRKQNEFVCIGIGTDRVGVVVFADSTGWRMPLLERGECFRLLNLVFADADYEWGGHHVDGYDERKLASIGINVRSRWCSLCSFHILHADLGSAKDEDVEIRGKKAVANALGYDLGFVISCLCNMPHHKGVVTSTNDALDAEPAALVEYCGRDVAGSWWAQQVMDREGAKAMPQGLFQSEMDEEMELVRRASKMSQRGFPIIESLRQERLSHWSAERERIAAQVPFNIGSRPQLAKALDERGIKVLWNPATGEPKLNANEIRKLIAKHPHEPLLQVVREYRKAEKEVGAYEQLEPAEWDGHVHPSFKIHGTVGTRWSSSDPNCQNLTYPQREIIG